MEKKVKPKKPCRVLSIVGRSGSGKTTVITQIIPVLLAKGLKVGTIKHTHHDVELDKPGKDSWKHRKVGAEQTIVISKDEMAVFRRSKHECKPEHYISEYFADFDIVIIEGFKNNPGFKIEIVRNDNNKKPLYIDPSFSINAIITDTSPPFPVPHFKFSNISGFINWFCEELDLK